MDKTQQVFLKPHADLHLHRDQIRVVNVLRGQSKCDSTDSIEKLSARLNNKVPIEKLLNYIAKDAPIIIHATENTIKLLTSDTHYRSTFETNTKPGTYVQVRTQWESECFLKLYDGIKPFDRPKYGVLNFLNSPSGVSQAHAYGDWYLELKDHVRDRVTIASGDTASSRCLGVLDFCAHVIIHLTDSEIDLVAQIVAGAIPFANYPASRNYREIQVHGEVDLARDIKSLNVPKNKLTCDSVQQFSKKFAIPVFGF